MEPIQHVAQRRKKGNSARTNLIISLVVHGLAIFGGAYWAAREGMLGARLQNITLLQYEKQKKAEAEKKAEEPKPETPKPEAPRPKAADASRPAPPPSRANLPPPAAALAAPPPAVLPSFSFGGDSTVARNAVDSYRGYVEDVLRGKWERPSDINDSSFVAEVNLEVDSAGNLLRFDWLKGSGDTRWDDSVRRVLAGTRAIGRAPPKGFPDRFLVRFDTVTGTQPVAYQ